jgi:hypothetical protein
VQGDDEPTPAASGVDRADGSGLPGDRMKHRLLMAWYHLTYRLRFWYMHNERAQYFSPRVFVVHYPDGRAFLRNQVDDENLPEGALIAEYRFTPLQKVYREERRPE